MERGAGKTCARDAHGLEASGDREHGDTRWWWGEKDEEERSQNHSADTIERAAPRASLYFQYLQVRWTNRHLGQPSSSLKTETNEIHSETVPVDGRVLLLHDARTPTPLQCFPVIMRFVGGSTKSVQVDLTGVACHPSSPGVVTGPWLLSLSCS